MVIVHVLVVIALLLMGVVTPVLLEKEQTMCRLEDGNTPRTTSMHETHMFPTPQACRTREGQALLELSGT